MASSSRSAGKTGIPQLALDPRSFMCITLDFAGHARPVAHGLKMKSIAQFVAQEATFESLRNIGVDFAGGFLFGQPQVSPSGLESTSGANPPDSWQI